MIYRHSSPISNSNYCIIIYIQQILKIVNLPVNYLHYLLTFHHFHLLFLYYSQKFYSLALFTCFQNIFLFFFKIFHKSYTQSFICLSFILYPNIYFWISHMPLFSISFTISFFSFNCQSMISFLFLLTPSTTLLLFPFTCFFKSLPFLFDQQPQNVASLG